MRALALLVCIASAPAFAAGDAAEQQALFERMMRKPADYDTTFAYVKVSTELGDYEAAIGALERLLFYNPRLAQVKYELGSLYYRLGAYEVAANYFQQALASPNLDPETRGRIEAYLPAVQKERQQSRTWIFVQTGLRYQSNASFTPSGGMIESNDALFPIDPSVPQGADWNWFGLAQFANDFDFQNQRGDTFETRLSGYATEQFRLSSLNVGLVSGSIGPRLALAPAALPGWTIKPYLTGGASWVAGMPYVSNGGVGVTVGAPFGKYLYLSPAVEWQRSFYAASSPDSILASSDWLTSSLGATLKLSEAVSFNGRFGYRRANAANAWQSYNEFSEELGASLRFDPLVPNVAHKWTLAPFVRFIQTSFDAPNIAIDSANARSDSKWQAGLSVDAPLTAHFGLSLLAEYERTDSNIPNYANDNWSVLFGPTGRF